MSERLELMITPEPSAEERAAIEAVVAKLLDTEPNGAAPGAWWQAGILEATEESDPPSS